MQNILVAYDGSEFANKAFAMALEMGQKFNSELYVISIARPSEPAFDIARDTKQVAAELATQIATDESLALNQGNLFLETNTNPLHHAAIIQYERAATKEFRTPKNKMECALIFSDLGNRSRTGLYLKAVYDHGKLLLDKCEAENPPAVLFSHRLLREFTSKFPDQDQSIDQLRRLEMSYSAN